MSNAAVFLGGADGFTTIAVSGQSDIVADASADTLTVAAGSNVTLTTNATTDTLTIAAAGGATPGGSGSELQYRSGASTLGGITGSSVSGTTLTFTTPVVNSYTATNASLTTNFGTTNKDLIFTANGGLLDGVAGHQISITFTHAGTNTPLSVTVVGFAITVHLATNGGGAITSTALDIVASLEFAVSPAANLVSMSTVTTGAGVVSDMAQTFLSGGISGEQIASLAVAGGKIVSSPTGNLIAGSIDIFSETGVYGLAMNPGPAGDPSFYINPYPFGADNTAVNITLLGWGAGKILMLSAMEAVDVSVTASGFILATGTALKTDTTTAHTALLQAYDVNGTAYKTFGTLTNGDTPDFTIAPPSGGTVTVQATTFKSSDGTSGATAGPFTAITAIQVKNGLVTTLTGT